MVKIGLLIVASCFLLACNNRNYSQDKQDVQQLDSISGIESKPVMSFEKVNHDFGKINEGEVVSYKFRFTNTGNSDLLISSAEASCGCTVPNYPKEPIAPGGSGSILVTYNSSGRKSFQIKKIRVVANTIPNITELSILVTIVSP